MRKNMLWRWLCGMFMLCMLMQLAMGTANAMDEKVFGELLGQLEQAPFGQDKLVILQSAAEVNTFTCDQVIRALRSFDFAVNQLEALRVLTNRIENPEEKDSVIAIFFVNSDRDRAREMLKEIQPAVPQVRKEPRSKVDNGDFAALIQKLGREPFGNKKLILLEEELAQLPPVPSDQVGLILRAFDFDSDRMKALHIIDSRVWNLRCHDLLALLNIFMSPTDRKEILQLFSDSLTDVENKFILLDAFPNTAQRAEAKRILDGVQAAHSLFGPFKAKRILFVLDASGSMSNPSSRADLNGLTEESIFQYLQQEVTMALRSYLPDDRAFNVILCTSQFLSFTNGLAKATSGNTEKAASFIRQATAADGMPFANILTKIMSYGDVDAVYFVTDGLIAPTERASLERMIQEMQQWYQKKKVEFYPVILLQGEAPAELTQFATEYYQKLAKVTGGVVLIGEI